MATTEHVQGTRILLRDYPQFFEVDLGKINTLTARLPHPLIDAASLQVFTYEPPSNALTATTAWALDSRNGLLKFTDTGAIGKGSVVAGSYFTWFSDDELGYHMRNVIAEHAYGRASLTEMNITPLEMEVVQMGTVVRALWSLCVELALDIDVSTPEGMFIPARQRYQQALQMMQYWEQQYNQRAAELNIGIGSLEVFRLRRVARLTGRYVPVYKEREFDDPTPPERLYPAIPETVPPQSVWTRALTVATVEEWSDTALSAWAEP